MLIEPAERTPGLSGPAAIRAPDARSGISRHLRDQRVLRHAAPDAEALCRAAPQHSRRLQRVRRADHDAGVRGRSRRAEDGAEREVVHGAGESAPARRGSSAPPPGNRKQKGEAKTQDSCVRIRIGFSLRSQVYGSRAGIPNASAPSPVRSRTLPRVCAAGESVAVASSVRTSRGAIRAAPWPHPTPGVLADDRSPASRRPPSDRQAL